MHAFAGEFETHVTVRAGGTLEALRVWAHDRSLMFTHIVLARGATVSQPMLTFHGRGTLELQLEKANALATGLQRLGCSISRVKVEVSLKNRGVPQSDIEARSEPDQRYFEFHVKLEIPPHSDLSHLAAIATQHAAHLSKNARRLATGGRQQRFVTQRCRSVGKSTASKQFDALMLAIQPLGFKVLEVEQEYVVYDSNLSLDAGWMVEKEGIA